MRLDTDAYHDGGIDRHGNDAEPDEPVGFEPGGVMSSDAETRANLGAATATAPDFWDEAVRFEMSAFLLRYAGVRAFAFHNAINDLRGCPKMSRHHGAAEGGGILPAASGEIALSADVPSDGREGMPLRVSVEGGRLSLSIGIRTLAFAFENSEANNPYDEDFRDTKRQFSISDPLQFAEDVAHELNREGEDGSTPLTRFLDSMMDEAVSQGSLGVHDPDVTADFSPARSPAGRTL